MDSVMAALRQVVNDLQVNHANVPDARTLVSAFRSIFHALRVAQANTEDAQPMSVYLSYSKQRPAHHTPAKVTDPALTDVATEWAMLERSHKDSRAAVRARTKAFTEKQSECEKNIVHTLNGCKSENHVSTCHEVLFHRKSGHDQRFHVSCVARKTKRPQVTMRGITAAIVDAISSYDRKTLIMDHLTTAIRAIYERPPEAPETMKVVFKRIPTRT